MKTLVGFATEYFTLWSYAEHKEYGSNGFPYIKQSYTYVQNLSKDEGEAIKKAIEMGADKDVEPNDELRGHSKSWSKVSYPQGTFQFGKYSGAKIEESTDLSYLSWYFGQTQCDYAKGILQYEGYTFEENPHQALHAKTGEVAVEAISPEYAKKRKVWAKEKEANAKSREEASKHFFTDGERVEIEVEKTFEREFEGNYGFFCIESFKTANGEVVTYKGSSPLPLYKGDKALIRGTISHSEYNGEPQTTIKRMTLMEKLED